MRHAKGIRQKHDDKKVKHWQNRSEKRWKEFQFNQPYGKGLNRLKEHVLCKTNFDPAVLWQWGTMQAMAVIGILKEVEKQFGNDGQSTVYRALREVGYDIGRQITAGTSIPKSMTHVEWMSFYASVINRIAYASLESPQIEGDKRANFHIDWCPHQDHYGPFDCRVQRYFVQGMIEAATQFLESQGRQGNWDVMFKTTIPTGAETCFFTMEHGVENTAERWRKYSRILEEKALRASNKKSP